MDDKEAKLNALYRPYAGYIDMVASRKTFVHDMCFDFYGLRLATCDSDGKVTVRHMTLDYTQNKI